MSKDDDGGEVVRFPRVFLPGSLDAPDAAPSTADEAPDAPTAGVWPSLPRVSDMAPPLTLTMPGIPASGAGQDDVGDEGGEFQPPAPEDPANPKPGEVLAVALAVVTAMGVAGAQGMWHRARRRAALADEARAAADKSLAKAAGAKESAKVKQAARQASPSGSGGGGGKTRGGKHRGGHGAGPGRGGSPKGPKARRDGRKPRGRDRDERRRRRDRPGWRKRRDDDVHGRKRTRPAAKQPKQPKQPKLPKNVEKQRPKRKDNGWTFRPGKNWPKRKKTKAPKPPKRDRMTWKAPKRKPAPGQAKAILGRRRWAGRGKRPLKRHRKAWSRRAWKRGRKWVTRWRHRRRFRRAAQPAGWWWTGFKRRGGRRRAWSRRWFTGGGRSQGPAGAGGPPPPPPGFGGMRPPPGAGRSTRFERAERVDEHSRPYRAGRQVAAVAGAPASGWLALPPGSTGSASTPSTRPPASPAPNPTRRPVTSPVRTTQYGDADLTIGDVTEADADMAEEITVGVDEARAAADGAEQLITRLEAVYAKVEELRVPGLLAGWLIRLMDKTDTVRARAEAIAATLPAAAEAISVAGANAAARHQPLADVVRDMGHTRPAEREYHDE